MPKTRMEPNKFFFKYYTILFHTDTITNLETGEVFKLSSTDIHLYCYFIDQFKSYGLKEQQFFESTKSIESKTPHASDKSIRDFIKKFSKLGLIKYQKVKKGGKFHSNLYTSVLTPDEAKGIVSFNTIWSREEETSPQEPQQPEIIPALHSSDDIHTSADPGSDDSQNEHQTESPAVDYGGLDKSDERTDDEKLESIYEEYKTYCKFEGLDYTAYQESYIQFMDKKITPSRSEDFKNLGNYLFNKDWDEESDKVFEDLGIPF